MSTPDSTTLIGTNTLTITSVKPSDAGTYWCAITARGFVENEFANLDVTSKFAN